jgi:hypothetical protein
LDKWATTVEGRVSKKTVDWSICFDVWWELNIHIGKGSFDGKCFLWNDDISFPGTHFFF